MEGWLYCMSNSCMPGLVKVGQTKHDPSERALQLYTTGVPEPFHVEFAKKVKDYLRKEKQIHALLEKYFERMNGREFFRCKSSDVYELFELMDGEYHVDQNRPDPYNLRQYERNQ
jgi:hypothetical protein